MKAYNPMPKGLPGETEAERMWRIKCHEAEAANTTLKEQRNSALWVALVAFGAFIIVIMVEIISRAH